MKNEQAEATFIARGTTELDYLFGALDVCITELGTSHNKIEVMERIDSIKNCIVQLARKGN